ncbi:MAG: nucleotidyltransferase family protein [Cytophagales bacterium]
MYWNALRSTSYKYVSAINPLIENNINEIKELCLAYNVKSLFVFGSASTNLFSKDSDVDLLVSFNPMDFGDYADSYFALADRFETMFKKNVDLVTDKSLSNPFFIASVDKTKIKIYG